MPAFITFSHKFVERLEVEAAGRKAHGQTAPGKKKTLSQIIDSQNRNDRKTDAIRAKSSGTRCDIPNGDIAVLNKSDLWLACWTQQEIAKETGAPQQTVADILTGIGDVAKIGKSDRAAADHATDEIAAACNCGKATISEVCSEQFLKTKANKPEPQHATDFDTPITSEKANLPKLTKPDKAAAEHATDFDPPNAQRRSDGGLSRTGNVSSRCPTAR